MVCEDVYHPLCLEVERQTTFYHLIHPDHDLGVSFVRGSKCRACKLEIKKYGYHCSTCEISFHIKCSKAVSLIKPHIHYFYHFWIAVSTITRTCGVCAKPCGVSFYGCIVCDFNAHAECIGFPTNVKNQKHQHTLVEDNNRVFPSCCSLCGESIGYRKNSEADAPMCFIHANTVDDREAATEEDQYGDIYLMYIERHLLELLKSES
ncbi:putative chromatin regulator PHD family [Arabidopsis thaliana]